MDRKYTLEDIEALREQSGVTYEEAVALLNKCDGDLARAFAELESHGAQAHGRHAKHDRHARGTDGFSVWVKRVIGLSITTRVQVQKDDVTIANLTVLYLVVVTCLAPWVAVISLILVFLLRLRVDVVKNSELYASETLKSMVEGAAQTLKANVDNFAAKDEPDGAQAAPGDAGTNDPAEDAVPRPKAAQEPSQDGDDYDSITVE
jgi:hypothetical protein